MTFSRYNWTFIKAVFRDKRPWTAFARLATNRFSQNKPLLAFSLGLVALVTIYNFFLAEELYVSHATLIIEPLSRPSSISEGNTYRDAKLVEQYIYTSGMLKHLEGSLNLSEHFRQGSKWNFFIFFSSRFSEEQKLSYLTSRVQTKYDQQNQTLTVAVQAFSPEYAKAMLTSIIQQISVWISELELTMTEQYLGPFRLDLERVQQKVRDTNQAIVTFEELHPRFGSTELHSVSNAAIDELRAELTTLETQLQTRLGYMSAASAEIRSLENRIGAIHKQIASDSTVPARVAAQDKKSLRSQYQALQLDHSFAMDAYQVSLAALKGAQADIAQKRRVLLSVATPNIPDSPSYPKRWRNLLFVLTAFVVVYGLSLVYSVFFKEKHTA